MARRSLSKKTRYEVFKRDNFTCQYCGAKAPDVVLEVDHIVPIAEGGGNDLMNLITACFDCNRGKGKRQLADDAVIKAKQKQLDDLHQRREQLEMLKKHESELQTVRDDEINYIEDYICCVTDYGLTRAGRRAISRLIDSFGIEEVYTAAKIAFDKYYDGTTWSWDHAFDKIGGVCYNRKKERMEAG